MSPIHETVELYSDGTRIAADLFTPDGRRPPNGFSALVVCHGWGGIKRFFVNEIASNMAKRGFISLAFDYRGFGASDGPRNRLMPLEQVADVRAAVTWLGGLDLVDATRIAAFGTSFGGGIALAAASEDERIKVAICSVGVGDCERWLKSLRPWWQWLEFEARLEADTIRRARTGESEIVDPDEIMVRDPHSLEHEQRLRVRYPDRAFKLTLESAHAVRAFKPVRSVSQIAPRASMFIGIVDDALCPYPETLDLYTSAEEPKQLVTLRGLTHHEVYEPQHIDGLLDSIAIFCAEHMGHR